MNQSYHVKLLACLSVCFLLSYSGSAQECQLQPLPSIPFVGMNTTLGKAAQTMLSNAAESIRQNPSCSVKVTGYYCQINKHEQQRSWERVNAVIQYLINKEGISPTRLIFDYGQEGVDCNEIDLMGTEEKGPHDAPAPHPNYSKKPQ